MACGRFLASSNGLQTWRMENLAEICACVAIFEKVLPGSVLSIEDCITVCKGSSYPCNMLIVNALGIKLTTIAYRDSDEVKKLFQSGRPPNFSCLFGMFSPVVFGLSIPCENTRRETPANLNKNFFWFFFPAASLKVLIRNF